MFEKSNEHLDLRFVRGHFILAALKTILTFFMYNPRMNEER